MKHLVLSLMVISSCVSISQEQLMVKNEKPFVIELVANNSKQIDIQKLRNLLVEYKLHPNSLYQWQNHIVIFDKIQNASMLRDKIKNAFPGLLIKVYNDLYYDFDRKQRCGNAVIAKEWDHIILTANLVKDLKMQKEYLEYHATQFQKWPEVAKGFCSANFQQLLGFRNDRQLVLVISIPKGESLDKLNPKTTENNPRVDQWNSLMKKYQEGIPGTKPGEVWVFLRKV